MSLVSIFLWVIVALKDLTAKLQFWTLISTHIRNMAKKYFSAKVPKVLIFGLLVRTGTRIAFSYYDWVLGSYWHSYLFQAKPTHLMSKIVLRKMFKWDLLLPDDLTYQKKEEIKKEKKKEKKKGTDYLPTIKPSRHIMVKRSWNNIVSTFMESSQRCIDVVCPLCTNWKRKSYTKKMYLPAWR